MVQELHDLGKAAELFAGDALCFATLTCVAAHLPYALRALALDRSRQAVRKFGIPVSQVLVDDGTECEKTRARCTTSDGGSDEPRVVDDVEATSLDLERYRVGHFATGVLTNVMQLQSWAYPLGSAVEEDGEDSADESDGLATGPEHLGKSASLPFHPAFMDAAVLTLTTPKWPLILDPEGIALR